MADELKQSQERLVYLTRLESWQALARKMAHEVKNSLTPIRLTMEEIAARQSGPGGEFYEQAAQIVVDEIMGLERRVRAFSEFASEPPVAPKRLDINSLLEERIAFLRTAHPDIVYSVRLAPDDPMAYADEDLIKGVLTNLLENAAHAAKSGGVVLGVTAAASGKVAIEVHDSGPGVNAQARSTLFEPTISFKRAAWVLGSLLPARARCYRVAISCWCRASWEEPLSVSYFPPRSMWHRHSCLCWALTILSPLAAQTQPPLIRVPVRLVIAPTSVTNERGKFINGLTVSDFTLFDNDVPQQIHEDADFLPISLAVAIQTNLTVEGILPRIHELGPLLGTLVVGDGGECSIMTFDENVTLLQDFTGDLGHLTQSLQHVELSNSSSHLIDATLRAIRLLKERPSDRRRILLLISRDSRSGQWRANCVMLWPQPS